MAEAHVNSAFGAINLLGTLINGCVHAFSIWQKVDDYNESAEIFKTRLEWQRSRLSSWSREWGIETNSHTNDPRFQLCEGVVANYLRLICRIVHDLISLEDTSSSSESAYAVGTIAPFSRLLRLADQASPEFQSILQNGTSSPTVDTTITKRLKWALQNGQVFQRVDLLATMIQDLYDFFPPPKADPAAAVILNTSLSNRNAQTLEKIGSRNDTSPLLAALAWLKSMANNTGSAQSGRTCQAPKLDESKLTINSRPENAQTSRFTATYDGALSFVESKVVRTIRADLNTPAVLDARIENVVRRLGQVQKPHELRTLSCLGMIVRKSLEENEQETTYNLIYSVEASQFFSLREMLSQRTSQVVRNALTLGRRFLVAQVLARAVMYLHLADWLHKGIRSDNVLFFGEDISDTGSKLPFLVGFEHSRLDAFGEHTENLVGDWESNLYRHPHTQGLPVADLSQLLGASGRYSKIYDIYSLGVILVELGLFKSAKRIVTEEKHYTSYSAENFNRLLIRKTMSEVRFQMGDIYAEATALCLNGNFDVQGGTLDDAFHTNVVRRLEICNA